MKRAICYFTGTGNSLYAGKIIDKTIGNCDFFPIPALIEQPDVLKNYEQIGIIFPVYGLTVPEIVLAFADVIPGKFMKGYLFAIATYGGVVGDALNVLQGRLAENGLHLSYSKSVLMPDNFTVFLPAPSEKKKNKILDRAEEKLRSYAHEIGLEQTSSLPKGVLGLTIPIGKLFMSDGGNRDKNFLLTRSCDGCGECVRQCPVGNIMMENDRPVFLHHCEFCLGCFNRCPKGAINYGRGTIKKPRYVNDRVEF